MKNQENFNSGKWQETIDVRDFIQNNYTPYQGDEAFLTEKSQKTTFLWEKAENLIAEEIKKGIIGVDTETFSGINNFKPAYLDKENEVVVGYQTDSPLIRIMNPYGGFRMVEASLKAYGFEMDDELKSDFKQFRKTHNEGVFDAYTPDMRKARSIGLMTGLPDAYGRGRIIGDYRRIALYGINRLIEERKNDFANLANQSAVEEMIQLR